MLFLSSSCSIKLSLSPLSGCLLIWFCLRNWSCSNCCCYIVIVACRLFLSVIFCVASCILYFLATLRSFSKLKQCTIYELKLQVLLPLAFYQQLLSMILYFHLIYYFLLNWPGSCKFKTLNQFSSSSCLLLV